MEKKGILPLLGLLILFAAACATTGSGNVPSASVAAIGTPEAIATLLGKWSGTWEVEASFSAGLRTIDCSMVIKKVDLDQKIISFPASNYRELSAMRHSLNRVCHQIFQYTS